MNDWKQATIGDVCKVINGGTPKTKVDRYWEGPHAWITPAEMGGRESWYVDETRRTLTDEGIAESSAKLLPVDSVILSTRAPIGHVVVNRVPMATNQGCRGLVPVDELDHRFLAYFLVGHTQQLNDRGTGTTFKELSATRLKEMPFPLPPVAEQERIVSILDEAFAAIDEMAMRLNGVVECAAELNSSAVAEEFLRAGDDVNEAKLDQLVCDDSPITYGVVKPGPDGDIPFVRGGDLKAGDVDVANLRTITGEVSGQYERTLLRGGEVLVCLVGQPGEIGIAPESLAGANIARQVGLVRLNGSVNTGFVAQFLMSRLGKERLGLMTGGSVQQVINLRDLRQVKVPLPSRDVQDAIARSVEEIRRSTSELVGRATEKLASIGQLSDCILDAAFNGRLTASSAELESIA